MTRIAAVIGSICIAASLTGQRKPAKPSSTDLVELDVVALDRDGETVSGLRQQDFQIKEDGKAVEIKTFSAVTSADGDPRSVTLLLDDAGIVPVGTEAMRALAQAMLVPARLPDEVAVIRFSSRTDEAFGDFATALERIEGYRGGAVPFSRAETTEKALKLFANIARQLSALDVDRKAIVCIGVRAVCDVGERNSGDFLYPFWVEAITEMARTNVVVYAVDPTGPFQNPGSRRPGIATLTGGAVFGTSKDLRRAADAIWRESGQYYLLGYWPTASRRSLHDIDVRTTRKGVHLQARQRRGD